MRHRYGVRARSHKRRAARPSSDEPTQASARTSACGQDEVRVFDGMRLVCEQIRELKENFLCYVSARVDGVKLRLREVVVRTALALLAFVTIGGLFFAAGWFTLSGLAGGLGVLFGDRVWLGNLVTGVLSMAGLGLGVYYAAAKQRRNALKVTIEKYEKRRDRHGAESGHRVDDGTTGGGSRAE